MLEIRKRFHNDVAILYLTGDIDINSADLIEETGLLLKEGSKKILCNFNGVNLVDYNGLSILAIAYKNVINKKGSIKFCDVPSHVKELFKSTRLNVVFEIYGDEKVALNSFNVSSIVDKLHLRRRFKRIETHMKARFSPGLSGEGKLFTGNIFNLSGEGLFIFTKHTFPPGSQLYIELPIKEKGRFLPVMGTVIWLADKEIQPHCYPGMGIQFTDIDKFTQQKIVEFIEKHLIRRS